MNKMEMLETKSEIEISPMSRKKITVLEILLDASENPADYLERFTVGNGAE